MTDDDLDALFAAAERFINQPCSDCGRVPRPYQLVEVRLPDVPVRWLCWACLPHLFGTEDEANP